MNARIAFAVIVLTCLGLGFTAPAQTEPAGAKELGDEELREIILRYGESGSRDSDACKPIFTCGTRATDCVFDVLMTVRRYTSATRRAGATPRVQIDSVRNPEYILRLIAKIEAPTPVDRLCEFIEHGLQNNPGRGDTCLDAALWLLAASGHPKGLAYLQYVRDCDAKSFDPDDRFRVARLDDCIQAWETNNRFVRTGQFPKGQTVPEPFVMYRPGRQIAYKPSATTQAMRRAYEEDPQVLAWDGRLDETYLAERLPAVLPAMGDRTRFILGDPNVFGRFYEPVLVPLLLDWHEGRKQPLESLLGRPLIEAERVTARMKQEALIPFVRMMTGDIALRIKKDLALNTKSLTNDYSVMLACHDPDKWIGYLLERGLEGSAAPRVRAGVALRGLGGLERPFTNEERAHLSKLLTEPRLHLFQWGDWIRGEKDAALRPLAQREPQAFREALKAQHLGSAVMDAILVEKLYDNKQVVFDRIEYAMLHDRDRQIDTMTPEQLKERLAKLPPAARARVEARLKNRPSPPKRRNINTNWLDLVVKDLRDDPDGLAFLRRLAGKEEFASQKPMIEQNINKLLTVHPEWK